MTKVIETHPVQTSKDFRQCSKTVTLMAYEVYSHVYGSQKALIEDDCRGGFSTAELVAFLYAHNFPNYEWKQRVEEVFKSMKITDSF